MTALKKDEETVAEDGARSTRGAILSGQMTTGARLNSWESVAFKLLSRLSQGHLGVTLPDGRHYEFNAGDSGPHADLAIHDNRAFRRFFIGGNVGFCESYIDGDWSSSNVADLLTLFLLNQSALASHRSGTLLTRLGTLLRHKSHPNSKTGSRKNIEAHYDLGNTFYAQWLDPGMTYSSALFKSDKQSLVEAQNNKYASLCNRLMIEPQHRVLEIGCGWGGFAEYVGREIGARVTAITISPSQHAYTAARIQQAGLSDRVDVQLIDYRDVQGQFDRIASVEMIEAVGRDYWDAFFKAIHDRLVTGGRAEIQSITIRDDLFDEYAKTPDYIQLYIFPGGMLPAPAKLHEHITKSGLIDLGHIEFGGDYARTLEIWHDNFQSAWPKIEKIGFDTRFKRIWELYMAYCIAGFRAGTINVCQKSIVKPIQHA